MARADSRIPSREIVEARLLKEQRRLQVQNKTNDDVLKQKGKISKKPYGIFF